MDRIYITNINSFETIYSTSFEEQEITISKTRDQSMYTIFVSDNTMLTKLKRIMATAPDGYVKCWEGSRASNGKITGYFFELNARCLSFRAGAKRNRNLALTEEQKAERKARFIENTRKARENKKKLKEIK